jgi:hypothetical protein
MDKYLELELYIEAPHPEPGKVEEENVPQNTVVVIDLVGDEEEKNTFEI